MEDVVKKSHQLPHEALDSGDVDIAKDKYIRVKATCDDLVARMKAEVQISLILRGFNFICFSYVLSIFAIALLYT